jgi:ABC-type antimicrobial peptide transport system permease subunit
MGMKASTFGRLVLIEHAIVAVLGIGIGVVSGWYVSRLAVSSLTFTQSGRELLPPFVMQTNWIPVAILTAVIVGSTLVAVYSIMRQYRIIPIHELTRDTD